MTSIHVSVIKKVPDLMDSYVPRAEALLNERHHGILLTGVTLLIEMCRIDSNIIPGLRSV